MGRKIQPYGFRVGITRDWQSRWFSERDYSEMLHEDLRLRRLIERTLGDAGISQVLMERNANQITMTVKTAKPGIVIGSIFVVTIVMGDFVTVGVMGGQQIASAGKIIETRLNALQFPPGAANAVILLAITLLIITALNRFVDIRKEL